MGQQDGGSIPPASMSRQVVHLTTLFFCLCHKVPNSRALRRRPFPRCAALRLAFLVDQVQKPCCSLFDAAFQKRGGNERSLCEDMRNLRHASAFGSMEALFEAIIVGVVRQKPILNSS